MLAAPAPRKKAPDLPGRPPAYLPKRTMIKELVGTVRTTSYELPRGSHVYGLPGGRDAVGSGGVISNWITATPSDPNESQRSFVASNKCALKEGCITSKSQRAYAQAHKDIRFKQPSVNSRQEKFQVPFAGPYGAASEGQTDSVRNLIEASYTDWDDDLQDYPDLTAIQKKKRLKPPKPTKASIGHHIQSKQQPPQKAPFKMKRFANIKARVEVPPPNVGRG